MMFVGFLILFIVLLSSNTTWSNHPPDPMQSDRPVEILRQRFARGDINWEEYQHMLKAINES